MRRGLSHVRRRSLLVAALVTGLAKQLAVLLLGHALASLLDDRTHREPLFCRTSLRCDAADLRCAAGQRAGQAEQSPGPTPGRRHGRRSTLHRPAASLAVRECEIARSLPCLV